MSKEAKEILEGFNAGYVIRQKRPELFKQLQKSLKDVDLPFFNAFEDGGKKYTKDKFKSLIQNKERINDESMGLDKDEFDIEF